MKQFIAAPAAPALAAALAWPAAAGAVDFSGTRSNISPGGMPGGRCGAALTIEFAPGAFAASGTSNLGAFSYTASHCIVPPLPTNYYDGLFAWDFGDGVLSGSYTGEITAGAAPGAFNISESIAFLGGTGRFAGATGSATALGTLSFGAYAGGFASFGEAEFNGKLNMPIPEPGMWAMFAAGSLLLAAAGRRRRQAAGG